MPSGLRMTFVAAALAALLFTAVNAQAWASAPAPEATDMVPLSPAEGVVVTIPGGGAAALAPEAPMCLQCRCCSRSDPSKCEMTSCCSTFDCDPAGKCNVVQQQCGCTGC